MKRECYGKYGMTHQCVACPDVKDCQKSTESKKHSACYDTFFSKNTYKYYKACASDRECNENSEPACFGQYNSNDEKCINCEYVSLNGTECIIESIKESMKDTIEETVANICDEDSSLLDNFSIEDSATAIEEATDISGVLIPVDRDINICITYDDYHTIIDTTELEELVPTKFENNTLHLQKRLSYNEHKDFIGYLDPEDANLKEALRVLNDYRNSHYNEPSGTLDHDLAIAINEVLPKFVYLMETINDIQQNVKWRDSRGKEID